eukprot:COSAG02_NODE_7236_length_3103_cov_1.271971_1_plen_42_part_10
MELSTLVKPVLRHACWVGRRRHALTGVHSQRETTAPVQLQAD